MLPYKSRIEDFRGYTKLLQFPQLILANATILMRMQLRNAAAATAHKHISLINEAKSLSIRLQSTPNCCTRFEASHLLLLLDL